MQTHMNLATFNVTLPIFDAVVLWQVYGDDNKKSDQTNKPCKVPLPTTAHAGTR